MAAVRLHSLLRLVTFVYQISIILGMYFMLVITEITRKRPTRAFPCLSLSVADSRSIQIDWFNLVLKYMYVFFVVLQVCRPPLDEMC